MKRTTKDNGKLNNAENVMDSLNSLPNISQTIEGLDERDSKIVFAILEKKPGMTWEQVAINLGITRRQLFNLRQEDTIKKSVRKISKQLLMTDLPDIDNALVTKAKKGNTTAIRTVLELVGDFYPEPLNNQIGDGPVEWLKKLLAAKKCKVEQEQPESIVKTMSI